MKFDFFLNSLPKIEKIKVNSAEAQQEFNPTGRKVFSEDFKKKTTRKAAVMAIISSINEEAHLTMIIRSKYNGAHSGQVAFAGGKWEPEDKSLLETAYREVEEEIGVLKEDLTYCRALKSLYVPVSDFRVYPFFTYSKSVLKYIPQVSEVEKVITIPVSALLASNCKQKITIKLDNKKSIKAPAFIYKDYHIWGATSMILNELKQIIVKSMQ